MSNKLIKPSDIKNANKSIRKQQKYSLKQDLALGKLFDCDQCYRPIHFSKKDGTFVEYNITGPQILIPSKSVFKITHISKKPHFQLLGFFKNFPECMMDMTVLCDTPKHLSPEYFKYVSKKRHRIHNKK